MILDKHNETHDKYIQALRIMDENSVTSEYHKKPDTPEEVAFMKETQKETSKRGYIFSFSPGAYERIFRRKTSNT